MVDKKKKSEAAKVAEQTNKNGKEAEKEKKGPDTKVRHGRFQLSIWKQTKVIAPKDEQRGFVPERKVDVVRACIQYSRKWNGSWQNQSIWCSPEELRDLQHAMDKLDESVNEGGDSPSDDSDDSEIVEEVAE